MNNPHIFFTDVPQTPETARVALAEVAENLTSNEAALDRLCAKRDRMAATNDVTAPAVLCDLLALNDEIDGYLEQCYSLEVASEKLQLIITRQ